MDRILKNVKPREIRLVLFNKGSSHVDSRHGTAVLCKHSLSSALLLYATQKPPGARGAALCTTSTYYVKSGSIWLQDPNLVRGKCNCAATSNVGPEAPTQRRVVLRVGCSCRHSSPVA